MNATSDPYARIAAFYDCEHESFRDDIDFYLAHIHRGPVLDVGAGTGRITAALGTSGVDVVGVDPSGAMLQRASVRVTGIERARLIEGTIADVPTEPRFTAVIFSLNVLWHFLSQREQLAALRAARERLVSGGTLYLDLSNPLNLADAGSNGVKRARFRGCCEDGELVVTSTSWDDRPNQTLRLAIDYDLTAGDGIVRRTSAELNLRYTYRPELELMVSCSGFQLDGVYGDYDLQDYVEDSPSVLLVAAAV